MNPRLTRFSHDGLDGTPHRSVVQGGSRSLGPASQLVSPKPAWRYGPVATRSRAFRLKVVANSMRRATVSMWYTQPTPLSA